MGVSLSVSASGVEGSSSVPSPTNSTNTMGVATAEDTHVLLEKRSPDLPTLYLSFRNNAHDISRRFSRLVHNRDSRTVKV